MNVISSRAAASKPGQAAPRAVVVGAGVAGLSAAIALRARGYQVHVVEAAATPGGKMREMQVAGTAIDAGPTVLTMPWVFEELFQRAGLAFDAFVTLDASPLLARHAWGDGTSLDLFTNSEQSASAIADFAGSKAADEYRKFERYCAAIWQVAEGPFVRSQKPTLLAMCRETARIGLSAMAQIDGLRTMWDSVCHHFSDPRLRQLFARYATYTGSSPYQAPGTLNIIAHVEKQGVYTVRGGMFRLAEGLARACAQLDVRVTYNEPVLAIQRRWGRAAGIETERATYDADVVVWAGDAAALAKLGDVGQRALPRYTFPVEARSLSALTFSQVGRIEGFPLARHTVFFSDDYAAEFRDIFEKRVLPRDPTVYACAQDRNDEGISNVQATSDLAASPQERVFFIINAPASGDEPGFSENELAQCERAFLSRLKNCGVSMTTIASHRTTPAQFHTRFAQTGGALYGLASHGALSALQRPGAHTQLPGLYLASGSAHPGAGVPMAALSGILASQAATADLPPPNSVSIAP